MAKLMNKLHQLLPIDLGNGKSIIFLAREKKEITLEDYNSVGIQEYIDKGQLILLELSQ